MTFMRSMRTARRGHRVGFVMGSVLGVLALVPREGRAQSDSGFTTSSDGGVVSADAGVMVRTAMPLSSGPAPDATFDQFVPTIPPLRIVRDDADLRPLVLWGERPGGVTGDADEPYVVRHTLLPRRTSDLVASTTTDPMFATDTRIAAGSVALHGGLNRVVAAWAQRPIGPALCGQIRVVTFDATAMSPVVLRSQTFDIRGTIGCTPVTEIAPRVACPTEGTGFCLMAFSGAAPADPSRRVVYVGALNVQPPAGGDIGPPNAMRTIDGAGRTFDFFAPVPVFYRHQESTGMDTFAVVFARANRVAGSTAPETAYLASQFVIVASAMPTASVVLGTTTFPTSTAPGALQLLSERAAAPVSFRRRFSAVLDASSPMPRVRVVYVSETPTATTIRAAMLDASASEVFRDEAAVLLPFRTGSGFTTVRDVAVGRSAHGTHIAWSALMTPEADMGELGYVYVHDADLGVPTRTFPAMFPPAYVGMRMPVESAIRTVLGGFAPAALGEAGARGSLVYETTWPSVLVSGTRRAVVRALPIPYAVEGAHCEVNENCLSTFCDPMTTRCAMRPDAGVDGGASDAAADAFVEASLGDAADVIDAGRDEGASVDAAVDTAVVDATMPTSDVAMTSDTLASDTSVTRDAETDVAASPDAGPVNPSDGSTVVSGDGPRVSFGGGACACAVPGSRARGAAGARDSVALALGAVALSVRGLRRARRRTRRDSAR